MIKKIIFRMSALVSALVFSLLITEIFFRVAELSPSVIPLSPGKVNTAFKPSDNPVLGYELRANAAYSDQAHSETSMTNSHGQWDFERSYKAAKGVKRIIMLGDSVVLAGDVYDMKNGITARLEMLLGPDSHEVLNFGVTGYCTRAEIELLRVKGLRYSPDLVILMFVWNDYFNMNNDLGRIHYRRHRLWDHLFFNSHLFRFTALKANLLHYGDQIDFSGIDPAPLKRHIQSIGENNVEEGLNLLSELSEKHGFKVLITVWPQFTTEGIFDVEGVNPSGRFFVKNGDTLHIEQLAGKYSFPVMRLSNHFRRDYGQIPVQMKNKLPPLNNYYTVKDGMHPNATGCRVAAEAISLYLKNNTRLLEKK